jgi:aminopeptidase N
MGLGQGTRRPRGKKMIPAKALAVLTLGLGVSLAQSVFAVRGEGEARNRSYHVVHYRIEVSLDDQHRSVAGKVMTTLVPFLPNLDSIEFDAEEMQINRVSMGNKDLRFDLSPEKLVVHLDKSYSFTDTLAITTEYTCTPRRGLYFVQPDAGYPNKPRQIWTQGEDMDNHFWFPCYDFPNDKATSEVIATLPDRYVLVSNGKLMSVKENKKSKTKTFHWAESKPQSSYLIMFAAGKYAILKDHAGKLPVEYYVYPQDTTDARICFQETPRMIEFFNEKIGFVYPWEKYAQVIISDFMYGGMENTSATTLLDYTAVYGARERIDHPTTSLIAHELAHQWWGDVVTCKDWRHLWLNEGFADYFDLLYEEYSLGRDEFSYMVSHSQQAGIHADTTLGRKPIVSVGSYIANVYARGASVLHMLRFVLGEQLFWRALNHYITKYQFQPVETNDLKTAIEEATGQNLYWFFDEWVSKAGHPIFDVSYRWIDSTKTISLAVKQTQEIDSLTGVFRTPIDIEVTTPDGVSTHRVEVLSKDTTFTIPVLSKPELVLFDKGNWLLKELRFEKSPEEWRFQAEDASDPVDRIRAIQALRKLPDVEDAVPLLVKLSLHDNFWAVREEAISALGEIKTTNDSLRHEIKSTLIAGYRDEKSSVRSAAVEALKDYRGDDVMATLHSALEDSSYVVVSSALRSFTTVDSANALATLIAYLYVPSHNNAVANTALTMIGKIDSEKAITLSFERAKYGEPLFTRYIALTLLAKYGKTEQKVLDLFHSLLNDKNFLIKSTAIQMLGDIGDSSVLSDLEALAKDKNNRVAEVAAASVEKVKERIVEGD